MDSRCRFKYILLTAGFLILFSGCHIPRDNILDPENTDSYRPLKVSIDAFVNTENAYLYNQFMLIALDSLAMLYSGQVEIAEYHRHTSDDTSLYHLSESERLYQSYLDGFGSDLKGVPDVFFNGIRQRVQGASSVQSALFRLEEALTAEITRKGYYTIEMTISGDETTVIPEITVARLGDQSGGDVLIKAVLTAQLDDSDHKRVVRAVARSRVIENLSHGDMETAVLPSMGLEPGVRQRLVIYVTSVDELTIHQCEAVDIDNE